jgi:hypothetical protein
LPVRKYALDNENAYMLRLETIEGQGQPRLRFDTKAIRFDAEIPNNLFDLRPVGDIRIVRMDAPERIRSMSRAQERLGFRPVMPEALPFGFEINDKGIAGKNDAEFVVIRISDGLITATVYQWNGRKSEQPWPTSRRDREVDGIKMRLIGDLPDGVMSKVLDAFIRKAVKNIGTTLETLNATFLLELPTNNDQHQASGRLYWIISQKP